jgi:hypothetical protein
MEGYWPVLFMLIALKIPAIAMIWLLYWASTNEQDDGVLDEGEDNGGRRKRPLPFRPRGPRRDPHGGGAVKPIPRRSRTPEPVVAQRTRSGSRTLEPARAREREHVS